MWASAGKLTDVLNPKRPAAQDRSESTLMDDIWAGAPFKDRAAFIKKVQEVTKTYQDEGCFPVVIVRWFCLPPLAPR